MPYRRRKSESFCGVEVYGDSEFRRRTGAALLLLQPLEQFELIQTHLAAIRQGKRSGVTAWASRPVFTVGAATWNYSPLWYGSAIAHDAYHVKLYRDAKNRCQGTDPETEAWSGKAAERACLSFQRQVLLALKADHRILDHIEKHLRNPTYQDRNKGTRGWLDYRKRWW
jgi:hypothetical protein